LEKDRKIMSSMRWFKENQGTTSIPLGEGGEDKSVAWELLDTGRYMPRRIRGSFRGRELG
jgi:hypothetical protein